MKVSALSPLLNTAGVPELERHSGTLWDSLALSLGKRVRAASPTALSLCLCKERAVGGAVPCSSIPQPWDGGAVMAQVSLLFLLLFANSVRLEDRVDGVALPALVGGTAFDGLGSNSGGTGMSAWVPKVSRRFMQHSAGVDLSSCDVYSASCWEQYKSFRQIMAHKVGAASYVV